MDRDDTGSFTGLGGFRAATGIPWRRRCLPSGIKTSPFEDDSTFLQQTAAARAARIERNLLYAARGIRLPSANGAF